MAIITPIGAFKTNYIWAICDPTAKRAAVVDPGDATPVIEFLNAYKIELTLILVTHHHQDHTGGIPALLEYKNVPVLDKSNTNNGSRIVMKEQDIILNVLDTPGHTEDHICFYNDDFLFCGDTLFSAGCGRIFEGNAAQLLGSLKKLKELKPQTQIFCGHEYTISNLLFAEKVDPNNNAIKQRLAVALDLRSRNLPTLPSTMQEELTYNPFLRTDKPEIIAAVEKHCNKKFMNETAVFAALREWKNSIS